MRSFSATQHKFMSLLSSTGSLNTESRWSGQYACFNFFLKELKKQLTNPLITAINMTFMISTSCFDFWLIIIKLSWIKSCRQIFLFKFTFANYLLCNEPCIILYSYLCSSKLFRVLLLILLLSFQRHIYDVFGRSNCSNISMAKKLHLWTIKGLQGT